MFPSQKYIDRISKHTDKVYVTSLCEDYEEGKAGFEFLKNQADSWREFGIDLTDFQYSTLKKENWAESWKLHFKTMILSDRLVIKPSWEDYTALPGQ